MKLIGVLLLFLTLINASFLQTNDQWKKLQINRIRGAVKSEDSKLYNLSYTRLAQIVDSYGPRMWGSVSQAMAVDDLEKQLLEIGFDSVYRENLGEIRTWRRMYEGLTLYSPRPVAQKLTLIGLGLGAPGNVTAEVVVVRTFDELEALGEEKVNGKIVLFNEAWTEYGESVEYRVYGPSNASKLGAVGMLLRSVSSFSINNPHTGATQYDPKYPQIPAAAISIEDAEMFQRMQDRGQTIVVHLCLQNEWYTSTSDNLIAEIKGTEYPNEVLLLGGHFDSWDTGSQTGANDDGGGVMVCLEALHVFQHLGIRPKRTIRFIAWSGEEMGLPNNGAEVYAQKHKDELHVLVFESDEGTTKPYGFGFTGGAEATQIIHQLAKEYLLPFNTSLIIDGDGEMVDSSYLGEQGVPMMRNEIEDTEDHDFYFTYHHSAGDSMYMMNASDMDDNVVAIAQMFFLVADLDSSLPRY